MSWCSSYSCWRTGAGEVRRYLCGHPIEVLARFARIDRCDRPGHDEFAECEQQSDVDDAPQADLEQLLGVGSADRKQKRIHDLETLIATSPVVSSACNTSTAEYGREWPRREGQIIQDVRRAYFAPII